MSNRKKVSALRPETDDKKQYHIGLKPGQTSEYMLTPGDPSRCEKIISLWDSYKPVTKHREYVTYTGLYKKFPISTMSTGMGCPAMAIAVEELATIGVKNIIRVGSSGSIQERCQLGDVIISTGAVRADGTSHQYVTPNYPAVAHYQVVLALVQACETLSIPYHVGITCSTDSFYTGQGRPGYDKYWQSFMDDIVQDYQRANVLNFEMESSALFTLSNLFGLKAGCISAVFANRVTNEFAKKGELKAAHAACEAVKILYEWENELKESKKKNWFPSISK